MSAEPQADLQNDDLAATLDRTLDAVRRAAAESPPELRVEETGVVTYVGESIAIVRGLPDVESEELLRFPGGLLGMAFNLEEDAVGVVLLDKVQRLEAGDEVRRTHRLLDVPVGEALLGRVVDPLGRPRDGGGPVQAEERREVEREAPPIMDRDPVNVPLQTGLKVIDAMIPVGRGQRELILGDRQTGKTAIALDAIINQKDTGVKCVYAAIGLRSASTAKLIQDLRRRGAMEYATVIASTEEDPPGQRFVAAFAAMSIGEYFRDNGQDALVILDDLSRHARAYREISLLLRRPPGREAFPGDIFYLHARLLERSTRLRKERGGGSLTALPIVETEAQNISAYIPTNIISITDGQIYLSPELFQKGIMPAIDVGRSVSRVGGKTQLAAYRAVAGDLRLSYAQFGELEAFARFGTRLDDETRRKIDRGRRVREILKQDQYQPMPVPRQIASLLAVNSGLFDAIALDNIAEAENRVQEAVTTQHADVCQSIAGGEKLTNEQIEQLVKTMREAVADLNKAKDRSEAKPESTADGAKTAGESEPPEPEPAAESAETPHDEDSGEGGSGGEESREEEENKTSTEDGK